MNVGKVSSLSFGHNSDYWREGIKCVKDIKMNAVNNEDNETGDPGVDAEVLQKNNRLGIINPNAKYMFIQYESDFNKNKVKKSAKSPDQNEATKLAKENDNIRAISEFDENGKLVTRREFIHSKDLISTISILDSSSQEHCAFFSPKTGNLTYLASFETNASDEYYLAQGEYLREDGSTKKILRERPWGEKHYECEFNQKGEETRKVFYDENGNVREETVYYEDGDWKTERYATFNGNRLNSFPDTIIEYDHITGEITETKYRPGDITGDVMDLGGMV